MHTPNSSADDWLRIGDDELAAFGRRVMKFASDDGDYTLEIDEANQGFLVHRSDAGKCSWWIVLKEVGEGIFRLSGPSYSPEAWYQLTLTKPAKIVYWPDGNIGQIDYEV